MEQMMRCIKCGEFFDSPYGINACPECISKIRYKARYVREKEEPEIVIHWNKVVCKSFGEEDRVIYGKED